MFVNVFSIKKALVGLKLPLVLGGSEIHFDACAVAPMKGSRILKGVPIGEVGDAIEQEQGASHECEIEGSA